MKGIRVSISAEKGRDEKVFDWREKGGARNRFGR